MRAFLLGLCDGFNDGEGFSSGLTFGDERDTAYDHGVNLGQRLARCCGR